jgi:hypothetical protein
MKKLTVSGNFAKWRWCCQKRISKAPPGPSESHWCQQSYTDLFTQFPATFRIPLVLSMAAFGNPVVIKQVAFYTPFKPIGFELEKTSGFR